MFIDLQINLYFKFVIKITYNCNASEINILVVYATIRNNTRYYNRNIDKFRPKPFCFNFLKQLKIAGK